MVNGRSGSTGHSAADPDRLHIDIMVAR